MLPQGLDWIKDWIGWCERRPKSGLRKMEKDTDKVSAHKNILFLASDQWTFVLHKMQVSRFIFTYVGEICGQDRRLSLYFSFRSFCHLFLLRITE